MVVHFSYDVNHYMIVLSSSTHNYLEWGQAAAPAFTEMLKSKKPSRYVFPFRFYETALLSYLYIKLYQGEL